MTKLDRAKELIKISDKFAEEGEWSLSDVMIVELHNEGHINWLIEQVEIKEQLRKQNDYYFEYIQKMKDIAEVGHINQLKEQSKRVQELERTESEFLYSSKYLLEQNKRYREALEFINEELELVLHANKGLAGRMFCIDNSKRKITEVLEGKE